MVTNACKICGKEFKIPYGNKLYCKICKPPKNASASWAYKYWLFVVSLQCDELQALFHCKKIKCKNVDADIQHIRTEMVLINEAFKRKCGNYADTEKAEE